jgi:hypothetical protein
MGHITDHRVRPHKLLSNSSKQKDFDVLHIFTLIDLINFILDFWSDEILRLFRDAKM